MSGLLSLFYLVYTNYAIYLFVKNFKEQNIMFFMILSANHLDKDCKYKKKLIQGELSSIFQKQNIFINKHKLWSVHLTWLPQV